MPTKLTIEEMQEIAKSRGGQCLSHKYINGQTKLDWRCEKGHKWKTIPYVVKRGGWCPICSGNSKLSIKEMRDIAASLGGKCISDHYTNAQNKLTWQCKEGHTWKAVPNSVQQGHWCPVCYNNHRSESQRLTIEEMQKIAESRDGKCLSNKYINSKTKLKWQCKEGHNWKAVPESIKEGKWCPYCVGKYKTINYFKKIAKLRRGKCLSKRYISSRTKMTWQCEERHVWKAVPTSIQRGGWCPICSQDISERICRKIFEEIFNEKFDPIRPDWLTIDNFKLELDGYCEKIQLAFEYQGRQHYIFHKELFHRTQANFDKQKKRDKLKKKICKSRGIVLIVIPYTIRHHNLAKFIINKCKQEGFYIPKSKENIDYLELDAFSPKLLKWYKKFAASKGGKCLSKRYITGQTKMKWQCNKGHTWLAAAAQVKQGTWCPKCSIKRVADLQRGNIEQMQELAKTLSGQCLSKKYVNNHTKLKWQCKKGHTWRAVPNSIQQGNWCPICAIKKKGASQRLTLEDAQEVARTRGGKCLSLNYLNNQTKLKWRCKEGHIWKADISHIKRGHWCQKCYDKRRGNSQRIGIVEIQKLAKSKGGECLSKEYVNSNTKLEFRCRKGHDWKTTYGSLRRGSWCPFCYYEKSGESQRLSIDDLQRVAKSRGGKCLSTEYVNANTKVEWQCKEGHTWKATPGSVNSGCWCPICARKRA
jgi:hypothetical protein